jgi:hypothetical protein
MLMNLLPGLRELRAPLVSGYLWLISAWLVLSHMEWLPAKRPPGDGEVARLWDLGGTLGKTVVLAVVTFIAYLIGSFLEMDPDGRLAAQLKPLILADRRPGHLRRVMTGVTADLTEDDVIREAIRLVEHARGGFSDDDATIVARSISREARSYLQDVQQESLLDELGLRAQSPSGESDDRPKENSLVWRVILSLAYEMLTDVRISRIIGEMPQLASRLLVKNKDLYGKYDRLMAEASVRMNVSIPLTVMLSLAIWLSHFPIGLRLALTVAALGFGYMLMRQGFLRAVSARDVIVQALTIGEVQSRHLSPEESTEVPADKAPKRKEPVEAAQELPSSQDSSTVS